MFKNTQPKIAMPPPLNLANPYSRRRANRRAPRGKRFNGLGFPVKTTDADGRITQYTYDLAGNLAHVSDSQSGDTVLSYDSLNRLTRIITNQGSVAYQYAPSGGAPNAPSVAVTRLTIPTTKPTASTPTAARPSHEQVYFNKHMIKHHFCPKRGIHPFGAGPNGKRLSQ